MKRYAIYYTPPVGGLAQAAAEWLGRDLASGALLPQPFDGLEAVTTAPRRYGFHATIKAPFRLADGAEEESLIATLETFCAARAPVTFEALEVKRLGRFLALIPVGDTEAVDTLAAQVVRGFERFRAPLNEAEIARRKPESLTVRQRELLDTFGYPYVMDEFRFHMTLSDSVTDEQAAHFGDLAKEWFAPHLPTPWPISGLALVGEDEDGVFHQVHRARLG